MTNTIYIHQPEKAFSFTRLPNFLFEAPTFKPLSNEAKVLYAFILRRTELSRKNGWADEYGRIYLYYPICPPAPVWGLRSLINQGFSAPNCPQQTSFSVHFLFSAACELWRRSPGSI